MSEYEKLGAWMDHLDRATFAGWVAALAMLTFLIVLTLLLTFG